MEMYPTEFECLDHDTPIFKIKIFDRECAEVKIDIPVDVPMWDRMAPLIREALVQMKLEN